MTGEPASALGFGEAEFNERSTRALLLADWLMMLDYIILPRRYAVLPTRHQIYETPRRRFEDES